MASLYRATEQEQSTALDWLRSKTQISGLTTESHVYLPAGFSILNSSLFSCKSLLGLWPYASLKLLIHISRLQICPPELNLDLTNTWSGLDCQRFCTEMEESFENRWGNYAEMVSFSLLWPLCLGTIKRWWEPSTPFICSKIWKGEKRQAAQTYFSDCCPRLVVWVPGFWRRLQ